MAVCPPLQVIHCAAKHGVPFLGHNVPAHYIHLRAGRAFSTLNDSHSMGLQRLQRVQCSHGQSPIGRVNRSGGLIKNEGDKAVRWK
jgi:hypothetical protein